MSTFVLVHGAWHGSWCWDRVVPHLHAAGHRTVVPTLTGLGERADELTPEVGLSVHVDDIVGVLSQATEPLVLVGHSYSGLVVRQAADQLPDAVERLALVDAWFGDDGVSLFDLAPDWFREAMEDMAAAGGDGWRIPPPPAETVGVTEPADQAWVEPRLTPQPILTFIESTRLTGAVDSVPASAIVVEPSVFPFRQLAAGAGLEPATLDTGHDVMVTAPQALATLLTNQTSERTTT